MHAITAGKLDHVPGMEAGAPAEVAEARPRPARRSRHEPDPTAAPIGPVPGGARVDERHESATLSGYVRLWWQGVKAGEPGRCRSFSVSS